MQSQFAAWAHQTMNLSERPSQPIISKTLKNSLHVRTSSGNVSDKSTKTSPYPQTEPPLMTWINDQNANCHLIDGPLRRNFGDKLVAEANNMLPENKKIRMSFLNGWYTNFTQHNNLRKRCVHGGGGSAEHTGIGDMLPKIIAKMDRH